MSNGNDGDGGDDVSDGDVSGRGSFRGGGRWWILVGGGGWW